MVSIMDVNTAYPKLNEQPSWVQSAIVPMAMMTFAMFLLDILQRLFPYGTNSLFDEGGIEQQQERWKSENVLQSPRPTRPPPTSKPQEGSVTSVKINSLFGKKYDGAVEHLAQRRRRKLPLNNHTFNPYHYQPRFQTILNAIENPF